MESNILLQILDKLNDGVYCTDTNRKITFWNHAAEQITGFTAEEVIGTHCYDSVLCHVDENGTSLCAQTCPMHQTIRDAKLREALVYLRHKQGHRLAVNTRVIPILDSTGNVIRAAEIFRLYKDIDRQQERIDMLEQMAFIDPLTQLPNRRYVESKIDARLNELKRYAWPFGILFIDVDDFKKINDTHGHQLGDNVLRMIGRTLHGSNRAHDTIGRFGGEEFVAIIANVNKTVLLKTAERLRVLIESSTLRGDFPVSVTISIGAAIAEPTDTVNSLIKRADSNLYYSKRTGRNRVTG